MIHKFRICILILQLSIQPILLSGCLSILSDANVSRATVEDDKQFSDGILHVSDIEISFCARNRVDNLHFVGLALVPIVPVPGMNTQDRISDPFSILIKILVKNDTVLFNPSNIKLKIKDKVYSPIKIIGPFKKYSRRYNIDGRYSICEGHDWSCPGIYENQFEPINANEKYLINSQVCFGLLFPVKTPHPEIKFELLIQGFTKNGLGVEFPGVYFEEGKMVDVQILGN